MATRRSKKREPEAKRELHYKVVELSSVDEATLERTLNEWTPRGWKFDGVQFAMRESSKRPSMAFMFFTREGAATSTPAEVIPHLDADSFRDPATADAPAALVVHAETDNTVPFRYGTAAVEHWRDANGCAATTATSPLDPDCDAFDTCAAGGETVFCSPTLADPLEPDQHNVWRPEGPRVVASFFRSFF